MLTVLIFAVLNQSFESSLNASIVYFQSIPHDSHNFLKYSPLLMRIILQKQSYSDALRFDIYDLRVKMLNWLIRFIFQTSA